MLPVPSFPRRLRASRPTGVDKSLREKGTERGQPGPRVSLPTAVPQPGHPNHLGVLPAAPPGPVPLFTRAKTPRERERLIFTLFFPPLSLTGGGPARRRPVAGWLRTSLLHPPPAWDSPKTPLFSHNLSACFATRCAARHHPGGVGYVLFIFLGGVVHTAVPSLGRCKEVRGVCVPFWAERGEARSRRRIPRNSPVRGAGARPAGGAPGTVRTRAGGSHRPPDPPYPPYQRGGAELEEPNYPLTPSL